jgi:hypothetical protein
MRVQTVVFAFAVALLACGSPPLRRYMDVVALDDGSALLAFDVATKGDHVGKIGIDGEIQWEAQLTDEAAYGIPEPNLSVHDRVVGVRVLRDRRSTLAIEALDLADGHQVWETVIPNVEVGLHTSYLRTDRSMIEFFNAPSGSDAPGTIVALDPATGRVRMRSSGTRGLLEPFALGEQLVLDGGKMVVNEAGTSISAPGSTGSACVHGGAYVAFRIDKTTQRKQMTRSPLGSPGAATWIDLDEQVATSWILRCFSYRNQLGIVAIDQGKTRITFVDGDGRATGGVSVPGELDPLWPASSAPTGSTRFMPVITVEKRERVRLFLLDLERHEVVWERELDDRNLDLFRVGSSWFLVTGRRWSGASLIAVFDGITGELRNAVRVNTNLTPIRPQSVGGGSLWLMTDEHWISEHHVSRLDAASLVVTLGSAEIPIADARDTPFLVDLPRPTR